MKTIAKNIRAQYTDTGSMEIVLAVEKVDISQLKQVVEDGKVLAVEIKQYRRKRSLDANAYLWVLCQKLAEVVRATKEEIYKKAIKQEGQFEIVPIKDEAVERWLEIWAGKGLGWFAEVLGESKFRGYKNIISYYGSSVYDSKEMAVLVDEIVSWCKEMGVETMPEHELAVLKEEWGN